FEGTKFTVAQRSVLAQMYFVPICQISLTRAVTEKRPRGPSGAPSAPSRLLPDFFAPRPLSRGSTELGPWRLLPHPRGSTLLTQAGPDPSGTEPSVLPIVSIFLVHLVVGGQLHEFHQDHRDVSFCGVNSRGARRACQAAATGTGFFRGRPRGRLRATTFPETNSCPPQTPHGSRRSKASAKHCSLTGHSPHTALAVSTSAGASAKNKSGCKRQGTSTSPNQDVSRTDASIGTLQDL